MTHLVVAIGHDVQGLVLAGGRLDKPLSRGHAGALVLVAVVGIDGQGEVSIVLPQALEGLQGNMDGTSVGYSRISRTRCLCSQALTNHLHPENRE